ncbi:MAG: phosphopantothenoylcysteine decarboxylase [Bacteroidota bacterium]
MLVTAGPTYEAIDPVRFIGNHSSGKMGFAIADQFASEGADVILIAGPVAIECKNKTVQRFNVTTAQQMYDACMKHSAKADVVVMAAAVADYTPVKTENKKIKKKEDTFQLNLKKNPDILAEMGKRKKKGQFLCGFALETNDEIENALKKLHTKKLDLIVLNSMKDAGAGFGYDTNKITLADASDKILTFELKSKEEVAADIVSYIISKIKLSGI